jgi:hypothetical protein
MEGLPKSVWARSPNGPRDEVGMMKTVGAPYEHRGSRKTAFGWSDQGRTYALVHVQAVTATEAVAYAFAAPGLYRPGSYDDQFVSHS